MSAKKVESPMDEIVSLNAEDLDVQELERRLELATGVFDASMDCYINICGSNCTSDSCGSDSGCGADDIVVEV
jgi:hypothetical protein